MSHEIRTPMTAILGYADLMLDENVGRDTREHVAVIKRNGEHLLRLINDILDLSKIEAGKLQIEPTRCSPVQVVAEVVSLMRPQAAAKQLKLKTELAHPLPETVLTDPLRLRQVLVNLVGNAIKFTDQGEVRLAVRLNADSGRSSLCFDVTDTGIGMNEEQIGKLFQPFSQVDNSSTRKFGGTGLGLCISKHLAEALGGNIEVRSEPGKGSTFSVTIDPGPLDGMQMIADAQEAAAESPPTATAGRRRQDRAARPDPSGRGRAGESAVDQPAAEEGRRRGDGGRERPACRRGRPGRARGGRTVRRDPDGHADAGDGRIRGDAATAQAGLHRPHRRPDGACDGRGLPEMPRCRLQRLPAQAIPALRPAGNRGAAYHCRERGQTSYADYAKPSAASGRTHNDSPDSSTSESQASTAMLPTFVYSHLAADPDLGELVDLFVQEMPDRINALDAQAKSRDWNQLAETAHQIKGTAGCYGFDEITPYAARLEAAAREAQQEEQILSALDELLSLCRRVRSGKPQADETFIEYG